MTNAAFEDRRSKSASGLRKLIVSEKDVQAAEQLLERIRSAAKLPDIEPPEDIWGRVGSEPTDLAAISSRAELLEKARAVLINRRHRSRIFKKGMFGEPAWEMLLVLYVVDRSGRRHTIGTLVEAAGVSMTTALRWLEFLDEDGLIQRRDHPTDGRAVFIELTDEARQALDVYFSATR